jgi:hypothetical protein
MDTASLMVAAIHAGLLTVLEADAIKIDWEANHRFRLKFPTFGDLFKASPAAARKAPRRWSQYKNY